MWENVGNVSPSSISILLAINLFANLSDIFLTRSKRRFIPSCPSGLPHDLQYSGGFSRACFSALPKSSQIELFPRSSRAFSNLSSILFSFVVIAGNLRPIVKGFQLSAAPVTVRDFLLVISKNNFSRSETQLTPSGDEKNMN